MTLRTRALAAGLLALALGGCDTDEQLEAQRREAIDREIALLKDLKAHLAQPADPNATSIFVSGKLINDLLAGFDGAAIPLPQVDGATLHMTSVRADFRTGFPSVRAEARVVKSDLTVDVSIAARIDAFVAPETPDTLNVKVHIDSIVPDVSWNIFNFRIGGLVRDIIQAKVSDEINSRRALGGISIPLNRTQTVVIPATTRSQTIQGAVLGISSPALQFAVGAKVDRIIYLSDGIHVLGRFDVL